MNIHLTKEIIRNRASEQSYEKGLSYFQSGAIYNPSREVTADGVGLTARCEGSSAPAYRLHVELDAGGGRLASCTCSYDGMVIANTLSRCC